MKYLTVWTIKPEHNQLTIANFPVELPKRCIELLTYENDIVLDPFMGSGTTAIACLQTNRKYIGFEISSNYFKVASSRIEEQNEKISSSIENLMVF
jgi:site-specific DNA-methyltransferase (adenine-specific)